MMISSVWLTGKNVNFGQIYDFCDFHDFPKAIGIATVFLGVSKISVVNFEINFFLFIC